jgi:hypothetical protein
MPTHSTPQSATGRWQVTTTLTDGTSTTEVDSTSTKVWTDSVTFGDNVPDWRKCLREGTNATTSMQGVKSSIRVTPGHYSVKRKTPFGPVDKTVTTGLMALSCDLPTGNPTSLSTTNADNLALGRFAQKVALANTAIQGGVVLGELQQTLSLLRNPARGLRRLVDDWGRTARRIRSSRRVTSLPWHKATIAQNLADAWLEVQFGWKPLLNDIRSADLALHKYNVGQSVLTRRITATEKTQSFGLNQQVLATGYGVAYWKCFLESVQNVSVTYRGAVRVEARDPKQMDAELLGFNPGSWLPTAWELMPYSFLIDYFTNVGGIIYGLSNLFTKLAWCNRTTRQSLVDTQVTEIYQDIYGVIQPGNQTFTVSYTPAKVIGEKTAVSRAVYTGTLVPGIAFELPGFRSLKWLNIAALVAGRRADRKWTFD